MQRGVLILFFFSLLGQAIAQDTDFSPSFSRHPWRGNNALLDSVLERYSDSDKIFYKVPLTFWIYTDNSGKAPTITDLKHEINQLNRYFNQINHTGIYFYVAQIHFVPKWLSLSTGYFIENFITTALHNTRGTINVHLVYNLRLNLVLKRWDFGGTYNPFTNAIIIDRDNFPTGLTHEIGHYFGLLHPHRNWDKGKLLAESVSRTQMAPSGKSRNCEVRGDYLCDTPAEPNLYDFTDTSCKYSAQLTDPWGVPYQPDVHNIMSYQHYKRCRQRFTDYQKAAMLLSIEHCRYVKGWINDTLNWFIAPDKYEPDDYPMISTTVDSIKQYHTFNVIYTAKGNERDITDFLKVHVQSDAVYFLRFGIGKYFFPTMQLTIMDNYFNEIYRTIITDPTVVKLPVNGNKTYYLNLVLLSDPTKPILYDYTISVEKFE